MFKKKILALMLTIIVFSFSTVLVAYDANATPFMDGFPDWAQEAMSGSD